MLAVLGDVDDLAIGVQSLPVDLHTVLANFVPYTQQEKTLASTYICRILAVEGANPASLDPGFFTAGVKTRVHESVTVMQRSC